MGKKPEPNSKRSSQNSFADLFYSKGIIPDDKFKKVKEEEQKKARATQQEAIKEAQQAAQRPQQNGNRGGHQQGHRVNQNNQHLVHNPYNFVPLTDTVITLQETAKHDEISEELLSGKIEYSVVSKSPIFVGDKDGHFYKDEYGSYSIPGSTMRGLVRSNIQILGHACVSGDIDDYSLMYRQIIKDHHYDEVLGAKVIKTQDGKSMSILKNVSAGYIECKEGKYSIHPSIVQEVSSGQGKMNYYEISERMIINDYINKKGETRFKYLIENQPLQNQTNRKVGVGDPNNDTIKHFKPYFAEISYEIDKNKPNLVVAVEKKGKLSQDGYMIITGPMQKKKAIYIIPRIDYEKEAINIEEEDLKAFSIDFNKRENQLKNYGENEDTSFFNLPKEGEKKPVFYIDYQGKLYFGFTPRLRIFYKHTIKDGIRSKQKELENEIDYVKSMLGYTTDDGSCFKSKIAFLNATLSGTHRNATEARVVLAAPKPTSYLDYLTQTDNELPEDYNSPNFKLRGIKQYWLKSALETTQNNVHEKVASSFIPLDTGSRFVGSIVYNNLTKYELGLLLWSIQLDNGSDQNIGKGRPYGYGRVKITVDGLKIEDLSKAYSRVGFSIDMYKECDDEVSEVNKYIEGYIDYLSTKLGVSDIRKDDVSIGTLLLMKDSNKALPDSETSYMSIDNRDYQRRKTNVESLATPLELISRHPN